MSQPALLEVRDLAVAVQRADRQVRVVDGVSFSVPPSTAVGIAGESGCGKSLTTLALLRLLPPAVRIVGGEIAWCGDDLVAATASQLRRVRGAEIAIVFQDTLNSLNPVQRVGAQIVEALRLHRPLARSAARRRALALLESVGLSEAATRIDAYPHELSGGMRQRVMIAMALSCEPQLLIADEPTTALDVTVQAHILALLAQLRRQRGMSLLLVSHDLSVMAQATDRLLVMYAGRVVESGPTAVVLAAPQHPYTRGLLESLPPIIAHAEDRRRGEQRRLATIPGSVIDPGEALRGCRFQQRCSLVHERCRQLEPQLVARGVDHQVACYAS